MKAPITTMPCLLGKTKPVLPGMRSCVGTYTKGKAHSRQGVRQRKSGFVFAFRQGKTKKLAIYEAAIETHCPSDTGRGNG